MNLKHLSDDQLHRETERAAHKEREALNVVLHHLKEVDRRRLFSKYKYSSLMEYAIEYLRYPEDQASRRVSAMRLLKEIPEIEEKITEGSLKLTHLGMAQTLFKREKKRGEAFSRKEKLEILEQMENISTRKAQKIVLAHSSEPKQIRPDKVRQVTEELVEISFSAPEALREKLQKLKGLRAHVNPVMTMAELIDQLCELGLEAWDPAKKVTKQKSKGVSQAKSSESSRESITSEVLTNDAPTSNPEIVKTAAPRKSSRAALRREVWQRAQSQCENCGSTYALEEDHILPKALGGEDSLENLRLLCRNCNQRAAIEQLGLPLMENYIND